MVKKRSELRYSPRKRRTRLSEMRYGPVLALIFVLLLLFALVFAALRFGVPAVRAAFSHAPASEIAPIAEEPPADQTQKRLSDATAGTVALVDVADADYLFDPAVDGDCILFAAGASADTPDRLVRYDTVTGEAEGILVPVRYDALRNPVEDDARILYVDAKASGGGAIRAFDKATGETSLVCEIAADIPVLYYETPYLVWKERTARGETMLYAVHLGTNASVTLAILEPGLASASLPSLSAGTALYATATGENPAQGEIHSLQLADGETEAYAPGMYVHDPKRMGAVLGWASGNHGADHDLYCRVGDAPPVRIAEGITEYGLALRILAFGQNEAVYAYEYETDETFLLSAPGERAQFAVAGENLVVWRSLDAAQNSIWKYMRID